MYKRSAGVTRVQPCQVSTSLFSQHTVHLAYAMQHTLKRQLIPLTPKGLLPLTAMRCSARLPPKEPLFFIEQTLKPEFLSRVGI